jgi:hypothetical protein
MKSKTVLLLFFIITSLCSFAQQSLAQGQVNIIQDKRVDELVQKHVYVNERFDGLVGYRIQIFFESGSNAKNRANTTKRRFSNHFSDIDTYVTFDAPHFKVRVGNFRTRIEAEKNLIEIRKYFDIAYIVPSKIDFPEL